MTKIQLEIDIDVYKLMRAHKILPGFKTDCKKLKYKKMKIFKQKHSLKQFNAQ